jgi:hypothetical protein
MHPQIIALWGGINHFVARVLDALDMNFMHKCDPYYT